MNSVNSILWRKTKLQGVIHSDEGLTMANTLTNKEKNVSQPIRTTQALHPVVLLTAELWFPGQRLLIRTRAHTIRAAMNTSCQQSSTTTGLPIELRPELDLSCRQEAGAAQVVDAVPEAI